MKRIFQTFGLLTALLAAATAFGQERPVPPSLSQVGAVLSKSGFHVTGFGTDYDTNANGDYLLSSTNVGVAQAGYAVWTNTSGSGWNFVLNDPALGSTPFYSIQDATNDNRFDNAGTSNPLTGWEALDGTGPIGTVTRTNVSMAVMVTLFTNASVIWLDPAGSDLTGQRGNFNRPFNSVEAAQAASRSGDTYVFMPGFYALHQNFSPTNCTLFAAGATIFLSYGTVSSNSPSRPGFFPTGDVKMYGGTFSNADYSGANGVSLANATNFYAEGVTFYSSAFFCVNQSNAPVSASLRAEFNSCRIIATDGNVIRIAGAPGNTNAWCRVQNCYFSPEDFVNNYPSSISHPILEFQNLTAVVTGNTFDFRLVKTNQSAADTLLSCAIQADTGSWITVAGNSFIPYVNTNGTSTIAKYIFNGGTILGDVYTLSNATNSFTTNVVYTAPSTRCFLSGAAQLNPAAAGTANITLFYTNNGIGYQLPMQAGQGQTQPDYASFCVPLAANATFKFVWTGGTGATGNVTNAVLFQMQ